MTRWGTEVLERLTLNGDETVLDAGCGSGRVTEELLEAAGFVDVQAWLHEEPTFIEPGEPMETFLATVMLRAHLDRLPESDRTGFVRRVAERLPTPEIDYVRLNILARRH